MLYHQIAVDPLPIRRQDTWDVYGNHVVTAEFDVTCQELTVSSEFELVTVQPCSPPVGLPGLPWTHPYSPPGRLPGPVEPLVAGFSASIHGQVGGEPVAFLDLLNWTLYQRIARTVRTEGAAQSASETLSSGQGACRDVTVLFMDAAACQGLTTRFVSGYQAEPESAGGQRFLHAWPEVFLPGTGFVGWDPTHGTRVGEGHVALCAAATQSETMPIEGGYTFNGPELNSTLDFSLMITTT